MAKWNIALVTLVTFFSISGNAVVQGPAENQKCQFNSPSTLIDHENYFYYRFLNFTVSTPVIKQNGYACAAIKKGPYSETVDYLIIAADDGSEDLWIARNEALRGTDILDNEVRRYPIIKKQVIVRLESEEKPALENQSRLYVNDLIFLRNFVTGRKDDYRKASFTAFFDQKENRMRALYKGLEVKGMLIRIGFNLKFNKVTYYPLKGQALTLDVEELQRVSAP